MKCMVLLTMVLSGTRASAAGDEQFYVRVSPRDARYFELSNGRPYVPIGLNMVAPPGGGDLDDMERWFRKLSANRGNYVRIWLSHSFFDIEHARSGEYDEQKAKRIDKLLVLARRHNIRLKLCIEHFRHLGEGRQEWAGKPLHHVSHGGPAKNTADFFDGQLCREQFKRKLGWYAGRYGDDPIVFGWELWNEINCIQSGDWKAWTEAMLPELHRQFPKNLAMQSLGSFDKMAYREWYRWLCGIPSNDVLQVHRYLDLGAQWEVCHGPVDVLAAEAVRELRAFGVRKPILLAESGAVEPRHTGPFKLYEKDTAGIILHDVLFAPFFAGAAGPGHCWHWGVYVDRMNLWHHFARFAEVVKGLDPPAESFQPVELTHPRLRILGLKGRNTLLAWCRDRENTWRSELAEGHEPQQIRGASLDLDQQVDWLDTATLEAYDPWTDKWTTVTVNGNSLALPDFSRSIVLRIRKAGSRFFTTPR